MATTTHIHSETNPLNSSDSFHSFCSCFIKNAPRFAQRVNNIYELVDKAVESSAKRYPTSVLNEVLRDAIFFKNVPAKKNGKMGKIYYAQQVSTNPPNIVVFCNDHTLVNDGYKRYLDRKVRESLPGYNGTPIKWMFRSRRERDVERKGNGAPGQSTGSNYPYPQSGKT